MGDKTKHGLGDRRKKCAVRPGKCPSGQSIKSPTLAISAVTEMRPVRVRCRAKARASDGGKIILATGDEMSCLGGTLKGKKKKQAECRKS